MNKKSTKNIKAPLFDCTIVGDVFFDVLVRKEPHNINLVNGGTSYSSPIVFELGGSGNIAVGLSKLGGKVSFIGKVGDDALGTLYRNSLIRDNIATHISFDQLNPTGIILVFVGKKGERSFLVSRGANDYLSIDEIKKCRSSIQRSKCIFISGYSLVKSPQKDAVLKAIEIAKSNDVKVIFDPGAHNLIEQKRVLFEKIISLSDVITPNLDEAKSITNCDEIRKIIKKLSKIAPLAVLKMGVNGCIVITPNENINLKSNKINCIDSTGAGDAFVSALIYGITNNLSLKHAAMLANWYASHIIQQVGSRSFPSDQKIRRYLRRLKG